MEVATLLLTIVVLGVFSWLQYKQISHLTEVVRGQKLETKVVSSPNQVVEEDANMVELKEDSPINIPPDVKIEVEGGDMTPPGYREVMTNGQAGI